MQFTTFRNATSVLPFLTRAPSTAGHLFVMVLLYKHILLVQTVCSTFVYSLQLSYSCRWPCPSSHSSPARPLTLHPEHNLRTRHLASAPYPSPMPSDPGLSGNTQLRYVGPVGELDGEHIFEVLRSDQPLKRDTPDWTAVGMD